HAHLLLAELLTSKGATNQSLMELRFAVNDDPSLANLAAASAVSITRNFDELLRSVPSVASGVIALESLGADMRTPEEAERRDGLQRAARASDRGRRGPQRQLARRLSERIEQKDIVACGGEALVTCEAELKQHVAALEAALPNRSGAECIRG